MEFTNHQKFAVCGYKQIYNNKVYFREFELLVCGQDTFVKFWHALQFCRIELIKDTLFVNEEKYLPTGKNDSLEFNVWTIDRFYFLNGNLIHLFDVNKNITKYNEQQVQSTLKDYVNSAKGIDENKMALLRRLFIATISQSNKARKYFMNFESKFGPLDGINAEDYDDLKNMLKLWDSKSN